MRRLLIVSNDIPKDLITPELMELKRQQILAGRLLKELKQWREQHESTCANV
jgi:hypothetical protein